MFLFGYNVDAACTSARLSELKSLAEKVEFSYDYTKTTGSNNDEGTFTIVDFKINAYNLNEEVRPLIIYDYYLDNYKEFKYNANKANSLSGFSSGERVQITFKAHTKDECSGKTVYTKTIVLPYYNSFYDTNECQANREFKYCQSELLTSSVSYNQFLSEFNKYLNKEEDKPNDKGNNPSNNKDQIPTEIIGIVILVVLVIMVLLIIVLKIRKNREKNKL